MVRPRKERNPRQWMRMMMMMMGMGKMMFCLLWIVLVAPPLPCHALSPSNVPDSHSFPRKLDETGAMERRTMMERLTATGSASLLSGLTTANAMPHPTNAAAYSSLAAKLAARDPNALSNSVFNVPPSVQVFPEFIRGTWQVDAKFGGFLFPSTKIPKAKVMQNVLIPGFQKCSIAAICDVGSDASYTWTVDPATGWDDRAATLTSQIQGYLGYPAVHQVLYTPQSNPNRLSIEFVEYKTKNAERIELFCNARESEYVPQTGVFVHSEYIRQVTFGTGSEVGIPRQVIGNYAHFWTWRRSKKRGSGDDTIEGGGGEEEEDPNLLKGNLLTAAYLDPQDAMFFDEPTKPVAVYSHVLTARRQL